MDPKHVGTYVYVLPTLEQAKKVIWHDPNMMKAFPPEIIEKKNDSEHIIWLKGGSIWRLVGADNVDRLRGIEFVDLVLDEYAEMKEDVWPTLAPVLAQNDGTVTFVFTPKGKNHGWHILQHAKNNPDTWFSEVLPVDKTNGIPPDALEELRKDPSMTEAFFKQEFYCDFTESGSQFFRKVRKILWPGQLSPEDGHHYIIGADLGKYEDFTVLTPMDIFSHKVGIPDRFNEINWNLQEARIEAMSLKYNKSMVRLDSTGLGDPVFDHLSARGIPIESFVFTGPSRENLLTNLAVLLEKEQLVLPAYEPLLQELESFQYVLSERGNLKIESSGDHDDCVMSLALAVWNLTTDRFMGEFDAEHKRLRKFYNEIRGVDSHQYKNPFHFE
jgi:hypothetical protein